MILTNTNTNTPYFPGIRCVDVYRIWILLLTIVDYRCYDASTTAM